MDWFKLLVEDSLGLLAVHLARGVWPTHAKESLELAGYRVLLIETWGPNTRWPNLPDYVGK